MRENDISKEIIEGAMKVHKELGQGLLESSAYQACLYYELVQSGLKVEREKALPIVYEEVELDCGYRIDLMVEGKVIIELKAVKELTDIHMAQILTYLKLSDLRLGLLINFNSVLLKNGIKRVVNDL